jgi:hypothetical protein
MKTGMLIQSGIGPRVTGIADGTEMVVMDGEGVTRHHHHLNNKRSGALSEKGTKMYPLGPAQAEVKAL